jgi:hypothetical protein
VIDIEARRGEHENGISYRSFIRFLTLADEQHLRFGAWSLGDLRIAFNEPTISILSCLVYHSDALIALLGQVDISMVFYDSSILELVSGKKEYESQGLLGLGFRDISTDEAIKQLSAQKRSADI